MGHAHKPAWAMAFHRPVAGTCQSVDNGLAAMGLLCAFVVQVWAAANVHSVAAAWSTTNLVSSTTIAIATPVRVSRLEYVEYAFTQWLTVAVYPPLSPLG